MSRRTVLSFLLGALTLGAACAGSQPTSGDGSPRAGAAALEQLWSETIRHVATIAEETPEADY